MSNIRSSVIFIVSCPSSDTAKKEKCEGLKGRIHEGRAPAKNGIDKTNEHKKRVCNSQFWNGHNSADFRGRGSELKNTGVIWFVWIVAAWLCLCVGSVVATQCDAFKVCRGSLPGWGGIGQRLGNASRKIHKQRGMEKQSKAETATDFKHSSKKKIQLESLNSQVKMCCLVLKASTSWSHAYHTPSCSTKQCWCSIYRDLLENSWLREWSEAVPALWSWNSWCHRSSWGEKDTSSSTTTSSLNPDFNSNPFFFSSQGMLSLLWRLYFTVFTMFWLTPSLSSCAFWVYCLLWVKQSLDPEAEVPANAVEGFYWQNTKKTTAKKMTGTTN